MKLQEITLRNTTDSIYYAICTSGSGEKMYIFDWPEYSILRFLECGEIQNLPQQSFIKEIRVA